MIARNDETARGTDAIVAQEFLTWLWWSIETSGGIFELPGSATVALAIEDDLVLRGGPGASAEGHLRGGTPTRSDEAAAALAAGKLLARARIVAASGNQEWQFTLDALTFQLLRVTTPAPDGEGYDPDLETFQAFEDLGNAMDQLLGQFLADRLTPSFERRTVPAMRRWIASKR